MHFIPLLPIFLGYLENQNGFKCLALNGRIYITPHVSFDESCLPSLLLTTSSLPSILSSFSPLSHIPFLVFNSNPSSSFSHLTSDNPSIQRSMPQPSSHNTPPMLTRSNHDIFKPKTLMTTCLSYTSLLEPHFVFELLSILEWCVAMVLEFQAFCSNNTWSLVPPPLNNQVVGCKWVFQFKHNSDGSVNKYKTRLVAKGFYQVLGFDFHDTYSPVIKPTTIWVVLALTISNH